MYRSGLVNTLVTHANTKGLGLTPLFGDLSYFMLPQLKMKTNKNFFFWDQVFTYIDTLVGKYYSLLAFKKTIMVANETAVAQNSSTDKDH